MKALLLVAVLAAALASAARPFPPVWPYPQSFTNGTGSVQFNGANFKMVATCVAATTDLTNGFARFTANAFPHGVAAPSGASISTLSVCLHNASVPLQLGVDESYQLTITATAASVTCNTVYGCYHAFETLSQLMSFNFDTEVYSVNHVPWSIADAPRFPHRGLLVDTSRHFLPVATLLRVIDSMTYAKLNTMHWHIVDAIAFPFDSPSYPQIAKNGAYSPEERFTTTDVTTVVEYARERGVRVMVELDTPGHSASMCYGMPEICPQPSCATEPQCYASNVNNWALDPSNNLTYTVVQTLLTDLSKLFPEQMMHLGGDEIDTCCWSYSPGITKWLVENNLSLIGGYAYYVKRIENWLWANLPGRQATVWQDVWQHLGTQLDKRTIIHQWLPDSTSLPQNVTSKGYRLIWSDSSVWYLDHLDVAWETMYQAEPCNALTAAECALVLGGEGCQWGETVDTSDIFATVWPRAAAIAERLWSPRTITSIPAAMDRFVSFRCVLNHRGIGAAPSDNSVARSAPTGPGSCYDQ